MDVKDEKVQFLRGILIAYASMGSTIPYEELRRLTRLTLQQLGAYLGAARSVLQPGEPDFCAVAVKNSGEPGEGFGHLSSAEWQAELTRVYDYWKFRRMNNNEPFEARYGSLPSVP